VRRIERQLDPLSDTVRNPDQIPKPTHYYRSDDEAPKRTLLRFFAFDGFISAKPVSQADEQENVDEQAEGFED
jgi:hypothetical protein